MAKENKTIYVILGLLNHEDMTGYEIKKRIDSSLKFFWDASFGQIYPSLKILENDMMVKSKNEENQSGPERIIYSITDKGKEALRQWLLKPAEKEHVKYEVLVKLFFGSAVDVNNNINNIAVFKERNLDTLKLFEFYKLQLNQVLNEDKDHIFYYLTVLFGEKIQKAYIEWAEEAIDILKEHKGEVNCEKAKGEKS